MPITLSTLFCTLLTVLPLFVERALDVIKLIVVIIGPSRDMFLSAAKRTRWVVEKSVWSLGNIMYKFYTMLPKSEVPSFLRQEWEAFKVWDDGAYEVCDFAHTKRDLWSGWRTCLSKLNYTTQQVRLNQQEDRCVILPKFDMKSSDGCFAVVSRVSLVVETKATFSICEPRQPSPEVSTVDVNRERYGSIDVIHGRLPRKRLWLGTGTELTVTRSNLLYYVRGNQCR